jgi:AcrR family transcriptional regulator
MQEIAAEAGVNQALLHYYFRSKERLAEAVFRDAAGRLIPAVAQVLGSDAGLEQKVEQFVHLYIDTVRDAPFLPGYLLSELHHHPDRLTRIAEGAGYRAAELIRAMRARLDVQIREQVDAGTMRPIAVEQFIANLMGLVVVPFVARPVLEVAFELGPQGFERFLDQRRAELPSFILNALRP